MADNAQGAIKNEKQGEVQWLSKLRNGYSYHCIGIQSHWPKENEPQLKLDDQVLTNTKKLHQR